MLFGSFSQHKPSSAGTVATSFFMGPKFSRDHVPTANKYHARATTINSNSRCVQQATNATRASFGRVSVGRVSTSYTPSVHEDHVRRTGRRKLVHRVKSNSDPVRDKPSLAHVTDSSSNHSSPSSNGHSTSRLSSRVQLCSNNTRNGAGMEWDKYKPSAVVKDYAAVSTQNSKFRKHMEDECVVIPKFKAYHGDPAKSSFFAVYDGHGGSFCARYAAKNFHTRLSTSMAGRIGSKLRESDPSNGRPSALTSSGSTACSEGDDLLSVEDIESCYAEACSALDQELAGYDESAACGSTAVTCLIRNFNGRTSFHIANIGDSRAILFANGATSRLTVEHKATNEDEAKRIRARHGIILNKRVGGVISVTRAFGQSDEKEFITADPHTQSGEVQSNDSFLVLASDGVTDVFTDDEITEFVAERLARGEKSITICKSLLDEAKSQGAMDNMTAVLICFSDLE
jgi:protein phosphatase PTC1